MAFDDEKIDMSSGRDGRSTVTAMICHVFPCDGPPHVSFMPLHSVHAIREIVQISSIASLGGQRKMSSIEMLRRRNLQSSVLGTF